MTVYYLKDKNRTSAKNLHVCFYNITSSTHVGLNNLQAWYVTEATMAIASMPPGHCLGALFRFGGESFSVILYFRMIQKILLKTFYQCRLNTFAKVWDSLRISWVCVFGQKSPKKSVMPAWVDFPDLGWTIFRRFYAFKWYKRYYWRHFINADWVY